LSRSTIYASLRPPRRLSVALAGLLGIADLSLSHRRTSSI